MGRSHTSISDEIRRNSTKGYYDPVKAQHKAYVKRHNASFRGKKIIADSRLRSYIEEHLLDDQSPCAISGRLKHVENTLPYVSKDTIYDFLDSPYGRLIKGKRRKKKWRKKKKVTQIKDRMFIDKRPKIVESRGRTGDCEGDFIVSGKAAQDTF